MEERSMGNMCRFESESESSGTESSSYEVQWDETNLNIADIYVDGSEPSQWHEQVHTNYFCDEANSAFNLFRLARVYITRIPTEITRYRRVKAMGRVCRGTLVKVLDTMVKRFASVLFPTDGVGLYSTYCSQKAAEGKLVKRMVNILRKLRRGSIEKRFVRACLFASIRGRDLYEIMTCEAETADAEIDEDGGDEIDLTQRTNGALEAHRDNERTASGSHGVNGGEDMEIGDEQPERGVRRSQDSGNGANGGAGFQRKCLSGGFHRLQKESRNDWLTMVGTGGLSTDVKRRKHFSDEVLVRMLSFLFRANNVQLLSWGTKRIWFNQSWHRFPAVVRKTSADGLWRRFNDELGVGNDVQRVGRTTFRVIVGNLTKGQLEPRSCIDYYQDSLINENIKVLKEIIRRETDPGEDYSEVVKRLDAVAGFLKYNYRNHLRYSGDEDGFHDIQHGLLKGANQAGESHSMKRSSCKLCLCPARVIKDIRSIVRTDNPSVEMVLNEGIHKFKLYMGHCMRAKVQQDRIDKVMTEMKADGRGKRCVIYMDFKMKQLPRKLREPSQDWFGKRGMTWHGAAVFYAQSEEEVRMEEEKNRKLEAVRSKRKGNKRCKKGISFEGSKRRKGDLKLFFIDTVLQNSTAQDTIDTANIIDSICARVKKEVPGVKEMILISDNAPCYVNRTIPLISFYICESHGLRLMEVIHPDAQQSKNMVDAHFGIGSRHIDNYIREKDLGVITPDDVVAALIHDGGMKGTGVDFVKVNRRSRRLRKWFAARDEKKSDTFVSIGKCADITFSPMENGAVRVSTEQYSGGKDRKYVMEEFKILWGGPNGEDIVSNDNMGGEGSGEVVNTDSAVAEGEDEEAFGEAANNEEIIAIADSIAGGAHNRIRREGDEVKFSGRAPIGITPYCGCSIKFSSKINYWDRGVYVECKEAFNDAQAELDVDEAERESGDNGEEVTGAVATGVRTVANVRPSEVPFDASLETMTGTNVGAVLRCSRCFRRFRREENLKEHEKQCNEEPEGTKMRQSTIQRAAEIASNLVYDGSVEHDIIYNPLGNCTYLENMNVDVDEDGIDLEQGWAERPAGGDTTGANYEPRYRPLIDRWFEIGEDYKERRMTAGMMLRTIRAMFPQNYDYPSERHIKNRITANYGSAKRRRLREEEEQREMVALSASQINSDAVRRRETDDMEVQSTVDRNSAGNSVAEAVVSLNELGGNTGTSRSFVQEVGGYRIPPGVRVTNATGTTLPGRHGSQGLQSGGENRASARSAGAERPSSNAEGSVRSCGRQGVAMKPIYANSILAILGENPTIKRGAVYPKLIEKLSLDVNNLPENFPGVEQVRNKVSNLRRAQNDGEPRQRGTKRQRTA